MLQLASESVNDKVCDKKRFLHCSWCRAYRSTADYDHCTSLIQLFPQARVNRHVLTPCSSRSLVREEVYRINLLACYLKCCSLTKPTLLNV